MELLALIDRYKEGPPRWLKTRVVNELTQDFWQKKLLEYYTSSRYMTEKGSVLEQFNQKLHDSEYKGLKRGSLTERVLPMVPSLMPKPQTQDYLKADPKTVSTDILPSVTAELVAEKTELVLGKEPDVEESPELTLSGALARLHMVSNQKEDNPLTAGEPTDSPANSNTQGMDPKEGLGKTPKTPNKRKGKQPPKYNPIPNRHATVYGGARRKEKHQEIFLGTQHLLELINQLKSSRLSSKEDSLDHKVKLTRVSAILSYRITEEDVGNLLGNSSLWTAEEKAKYRSWFEDCLDHLNGFHATFSLSLMLRHLPQDWVASEISSFIARAQSNIAAIQIRTLGETDPEEAERVLGEEEAALFAGNMISTLSSFTMTITPVIEYIHMHFLEMQAEREGPTIGLLNAAKTLEESIKSHTSICQELMSRITNLIQKGYSMSLEDTGVLMKSADSHEGTTVGSLVYAQSVRSSTPTIEPSIPSIPKRAEPEPTDMLSKMLSSKKKLKPRSTSVMEF
jgi:hypothetical protein